MANEWPHVDSVYRAGERESLEAFLDDYRAAIVRKATGLSDADASRRLLPTETTAGGLVKHLRWVEQGWFQEVLAQTPADELPTPPWTDDDPDADIRLDPGESLDDEIAAYQQECVRSQETAARFALDDTAPHARRGLVSLRWIYLHMIEETARHAGHLDILRELIDGTVGD